MLICRAVVNSLDMHAGHEQVDDVRRLFDAAWVSHATGELDYLLPVQLLQQTTRVARQRHGVEGVVHETHDVPLTEHQCINLCRYMVRVLTVDGATRGLGGQRSRWVNRST